MSNGSSGSGSGGAVEVKKESILKQEYDRVLMLQRKLRDVRGRIDSLSNQLHGAVPDKEPSGIVEGASEGLVSALGDLTRETSRLEDSVQRLEG